MTIILTLIAGFFIGSLGGFLGIGGGVVFVPFLIYVYKMDIYTAVGTSLAVIAPVALMGGISHGLKNHVDLAPVLFLVIGAMAGVFMSGQTIQYIPANVLRKCFAVFLVFIAVKLFLK